MTIWSFNVNFEQILEYQCFQLLTPICHLPSLASSPLWYNIWNTIDHTICTSTSHWAALSIWNCLIHTWAFHNISLCSIHAYLRVKVSWAGQLAGETTTMTTDLAIKNNELQHMEAERTRTLEMFLLSKSFLTHNTIAFMNAAGKS